MDEVFLALTGHGVPDDEPAEPGEMDDLDAPAPQVAS
jgi:hypothetical protein